MADLYHFESMSRRLGPVAGHPVNLAPTGHSRSYVFQDDPPAPPQETRRSGYFLTREFREQLAARFGRRSQRRRLFSWRVDSSQEMDCEATWDRADSPIENLMTSGPSTVPTSVLQDQEAAPVPSNAPHNQRGPLASTATWVRLNKGKRNKAGPNIRRLRKVRGMSQSEIVDQLAKYDVAMGQGVLAKVETQQRAIFDYELEAFALVLGVSLEELTRA